MMNKSRERNFRILEFKNNQFDIIGDIHGCYDELIALVTKLGYENKNGLYIHPEGRKLISVGDLADKGPKNLQCIYFWMDHIAYAGAHWIHGNHCNKLYRYFLGNKVHISKDMECTLSEYEALSKDDQRAFRQRYMTCYESQCYYLLLDKKKLAVVHGGLPAESIGHFSNKIRAVCLYGETTGEVNEHGRPHRLDWGALYQGDAFVVYGHTVVRDAVVVNQTIDIDQGCVYGGALTAFRYPEKEIVQVEGTAYAVYKGTSDF
ncbi:metallophosphoesterase [Chakrabartyella piscis]|uniref:metallophosphoesterase n=1 Tax=Chakrabartyella piscis TaxID=2918914 RepID=UPI0029586DB9|nr:metallophosphoesterase [Chakrabartyella piscis]